MAGQVLAYICAHLAQPDAEVYDAWLSGMLTASGCQAGKCRKQVRCASPTKPTELTTTSLMWSRAKAWTEELLLFRHMMYMPIFITMTPTVPPALFVQSELLKTEV